MKSSQPVVSVLIPVWNDQDTISNCLRSVFSSSYSNFEVIVVDNGSTDETSSIVDHKFPQVKILRNHLNVGVGAALNQAAKVAKGEYLLWLNSDAELAFDWLDEIIKRFQDQPQLGMASSIVILRGPDKLVWGAGGYVDGATGLAWDHGKGEVLSRVSLPHDLDYVSGCASMIRREALEAAGGLDPGYFMYFEDTEIGMRVKAAGYKLRIVSSIVATHGSQFPSEFRRNAEEKLFRFVRSNLRFVVKNWKSPRVFVTFWACASFYLTFALFKGASRYLPLVVQAIAWNLTNFNGIRMEARKSLPAVVPPVRSASLVRSLIKIVRNPHMLPY